MKISVPGRVNLIGEHIDYHNQPVLPIAIGRYVNIEFERRNDARIRAQSDGRFGERGFDWTARLSCGQPGDWANYLKAAAQAVSDRWGPGRGIDARVTSDLPPAAGLSSSSALMVGFVLALLEANGIHATFDELMEILPEAEYFVGTRGGGMDHAAVLAPRPGCALLVRFAPVSVEHVPVPPGWSFLVAHSMVMAEKSGSARQNYNSRRSGGGSALKKLNLSSYSNADARADLTGLTPEERDAYLHTTGERDRVMTAVQAMRDRDADAFGRALYASHDSMRDLLRISCPEIDELVEAARAAGALGARLTGGGFGGCAVVFCSSVYRPRIAKELERRYYATLPGFDPAIHLIPADPVGGALHES